MTILSQKGFVNGLRDFAPIHDPILVVEMTTTKKKGIPIFHGATYADVGAVEDVEITFNRTIGRRRAKGEHDFMMTAIHFRLPQPADL